MPHFGISKILMFTAIFNFKILNVLLLFTWRKLKRPLTWSLKKTHRQGMCVVRLESLEDNDIHIFHKRISPKVKVIARLEFEIVYNIITVQHISHCTIGTHHVPSYIVESFTGTALSSQKGPGSIYNESVPPHYSEPNNFCSWMLDSVAKATELRIKEKGE